MKKKINKKPSSYQILQNKYEGLNKELDTIKNDINIKDKKVRSNQLISSTIPYVNTLYRIQSDLNTFNNALIFAMNVHNPQRIELFRLYQDIMLDAHLSSVINTRKASVLSAGFILVDKDGKENEENSNLLDTKWFYDFLNLSLDENYFGFSLIEFGDLIDNEFQYILEVPRQYVKPEFGIVGASTADLTGESYLDLPYSNWAILVGEKHNLGLLAKAAPYVLWKRNAMIAYAEFCEMNQAIRILYSDSFDEETRQAGENFMRTLGSSAYAVLGKDDEVDFAETRNAAGAEQLYNGLIDKCNQELSKLILGGTGIVEEKSFVGATKTHQDVFNLICGQDKFKIENVLNHQLLPFLINHGFPFKGYKFKCKPDEELNLNEQFKIVAKFLDYYDIPTEFIKEKFGIEVFQKGSLYPIQNTIESSKKDKKQDNLLEE